jgi:hypothetical protein
MDITQSRTVLVFSGAGTVKGSITNYAGRAVDVAPTILKILGAEKTAGIDLAGRFKSGLYMKWQDGIALDDVMNGDRAENAVLFVFDGLSFTELKRALDNDDPKLPAFKEIIANGTFFNYGAVSNYPSISLPGHMTVGTGVYSGHHGLANNIFYDRVFDTVENIITAGAATARLQRPWTETIFEAAARSFGLWDERRQKGAFYASINEMIMRGAQYSSFANIFNYSKQAFSEELPVTKGYETYSGADNTAVKQFIYLYERGELPIPKITAVNIALIDFISHGHGPHGDLTRQALADTDVRLGRMLKALRNAGIYEKTLIVLTGDHGQELQDRKRSLEYHIVNNEFRVPVLDVLGIKYIGAAPFMYLKTMELLVEPKSPAPGTTLDITVAVRNEDTGKALPDVNVKLVNGIATVPVCVTDQTGSCTIKDVTLTAPLGILAAHKDFNPATYP